MTELDVFLGLGEVVIFFAFFILALKLFGNAIKRDK